MSETPKDERTEGATSRKRREAREKGQVPSSTEVNTALLLVGFGIALALGGGALADTSVRGLSAGLESIRRAGPGGDAGLRDLVTIDVALAVALLRGALMAFAPAALMLILPVAAAVTLAAYAQVGFQVAPQAVGFDPNKINPVKGFGRLFSLRSVMRTVLASGKITLLVVVMAIMSALRMHEIGLLSALELGPALLGSGRIVAEVVAAGVVAILILAVLDLAYQRYQHEVDLRMSKKEVREENRDTEGDPQVKARIRSAQLEMAGKRMMSEVPEASVVITNPTHFAVALFYDKDDPIMGAPRVVAKGADHVALAIRELARSEGVPLVEDPPLARALYAGAEVGELVPRELFAAVASVLAYVYGLDARKGAGAPALS